MSENVNDWEAVHQWLQPKHSKYWVEEPSLTQKVFLRSDAKEALFGGMAGGGKELCLDTLVPTPDGLVPLRDIHTGDNVFGRDGKIYQVLAESEPKKHNSHTLVFDDGSSVTCNADHLWLTFDSKELSQLTRRSEEWRKSRNAARPSRANYGQGSAKSEALAERNRAYPQPVKPLPTGTVRTTQELMDTIHVRDNRSNHAIPVAEPLEFETKKLPKDPYDAGSAYWVESKEDLIPYLYGDIEQRMSFLQGLLDVEATCNGSSIQLVTNNELLAKAVSFLVRSLGMKAKVTFGPSIYKNGKTINGWVIRFTATTQVFRNSAYKKRLRLKNSRTSQFRYLRKVHTNGLREMKCLKVNSPDELFLVSESMIPTHNSSALLMAALQYVDIPDYSAILFRRTYADLALPGALMDRFVQWMSNFDDVSWNSSMHVATFPSGARVTFGYLNNKDDYLRYKGPLAPDTDALTLEGWKPIADVKVGDLVASLDPETKEWDYQPVTHTWEYEVDEPLYSPRPGSDVSFSCTGDHTWWVSTPRRSDLRRYQTNELPKVARFPQMATFSGGEAPGTSIFPAGKTGPKANNLVFSPLDWANFLGWYIAEGSGSSGTINITLYDNHAPQFKNELQMLLEQSGANIRRNHRNLHFTNSNLLRWLKANTGTHSYNKRIPQEVFGWDAKHSEALLSSLVEGDGTWRHSNSGHFVTTSQQLADDVMRLGQHCGFRATLDIRDDHTTTPDGRQHQVRAFHVYLLRSHGETGISLSTDSEPIIATPYKGKVHCLTVPPHHTFLTRHNGRVVWTGNSEYQAVLMDEVTEIRENDYRYMFSRLRRPASGPLSKVPLRMRAATNPAPNWVRTRFIEDGEANGRIFIPSSLDDNPGIDANSYREQLEQLDPVERSRLQYGDWWASSLGSMFNREDFTIIEPSEIPPITKSVSIVRFWDLAGTAPTDSNPDPDWTVGTLAMFHDGAFYVLDVTRARLNGPEVEKLIQRTADEDGVEIPIKMEQEPGSAGKNLLDQYARHVLPGYTFGGFRATGAKETRAKPLSAAVANGNVYLVRASWNTDFIDEFSAFPESRVHDDQVDATVHAFNTVAGLGNFRRKLEIIV